MDKNISAKNYVYFKKCVYDHTKRSIVFVYPNGKKYVVPIAEILTWFLKPHFQKRNGKLIAWVGKYRKKRFLANKRRIRSNHILRLYFNDGAVYDVAWDTVLMACEPKYEYYGGIKR